MKKIIVASICIAMLSVACENAQTPQNNSSMSSTGSSMSESSNISKNDRNDIELSQGADSSDAMNLANTLLSAVKPQGELISLTSSTVKNFYTLPENTQYGIHVSALWTGEEIAVLKLEGAKDQLIEALKSRLSALKASLEGYKDDVYAMVNENAVILTCGDYVAFLSGTKENVAAAREALETTIGTKSEVIV